MADSVQKLPDICCYNLLIPRKSNPASLYLNKTWWIATKICCNMVATIHPKGTWKWSELFELFASCGFFACWSCNVWWTLPMTLLAATWFERQSCEGIRCLYGDNDRQTCFFWHIFIHNTSLMKVFVSVHSPFGNTRLSSILYKYFPLLWQICILWLVRTNWFTVVNGFNLARGSLTPVIRWVCFHYDWNASLGDFNLKFWWVGVGGLSFSIFVSQKIRLTPENWIFTTFCRFSLTFVTSFCQWLKLKASQTYLYVTCIPYTISDVYTWIQQSER